MMMPFRIHGDEVPAGIVPVYDGLSGTSALTYDWAGACWADATDGRDGDSWRVLMGRPLGRHMASYKIARVLLELKASGRPTFGDVMVTWRPAGRGSLVEVGLLWSDAHFILEEGDPVELPPWMSAYDLDEAGLLESRRLADVEEVMES